LMGSAESSAMRRRFRSALAPRLWPEHAHVEEAEYHAQGVMKGFDPMGQSIEQSDREEIAERESGHSLQQIEIAHREL
jgi:hypothetical protein